jgi:hypothetical protein
VRHISFLALVCLVFIAACGPSPEQQTTLTVAAATTTAAAWTLTPVPTNTPTPTLTFTATSTFTHAFTPTSPSTPTPTLIPSRTPTPTFAFPSVTVTMQAHCRYGPAKSYLHAADLYAGDMGTVRGRYVNSNWLMIKFDKLNYFCWVAPSVINIQGDITKIRYTEPLLPGPSVLYGPPQNVNASRSGDQVTVTWDALYMTVDDDRGYMLDVFVCQDGAYLWWPVGDGTLIDQYHTSYTFTDQTGCSLPSGGKLFAVEKHGYTTFVDIPWPP